MILFMDGMSHYATAQIAKKYTVVDSSDTSWTIVPEGRFYNALKRTATFPGSSGYVEVAPLMTQSGAWVPNSSGVWGSAVKIEQLSAIAQGGTNSIQQFFGVYESGFRVFHVSLNQNGTFTAYRSANGAFGVNGVALGTSVQGLRSNVWAFVEIKWNISQSQGYVQVCVNEVPVLSYGITAERNGTPTSGYVWGSLLNWPFLGTWTSVRWGSIGQGSPPYRSAWFCDTYLADLAGGAEELHDYTGDITIDKIVPEAPGYVAGWTPLSGANWNNVEETPPDDGLTYVSATGISTRDSYTMQDVPPGTEPVAYQALVYTRKVTEGASTLSPTMRSGGTTYDATPQGVSTVGQYRYIIQPYDTNPATGNRITEAELNAAEFGVVKVG